MAQFAQMGAQVVGSELQGWAAMLEQQAMMQALQDQLARQRQLQNLGTYQLRSYLPSLGAESATKQLGQAATTRQTGYNTANATPLTAGGQGATAADRAQLQLGGQQRAALGAYGDWRSNQAVSTDKMQDVISRIGQRAQGLQSVFPYSMDAAQHSQDLLNALGASLSAAGGSNVNWQQIFSRPQSMNTNYPGGDTGGFGGAGVDYNAGSSPYVNYA